MSGMYRGYVQPRSPVKHGLSVLSNIIGLISYRQCLARIWDPGMYLYCEWFPRWLLGIRRITHDGVFHDVCYRECIYHGIGMILIITGLILNYLVILLRNRRKTINQMGQIFLLICIGVFLTPKISDNSCEK